MEQSWTNSEIKFNILSISMIFEIPAYDGWNYLKQPKGFSSLMF